ncbi:hypothetical protein AURDEDRAFT_126407 [Auricularia subglabra TFB-10046 SS5]|nr:hypothetical protein AURDEDRAFT_126407 [Auricularia subglabra TFB-10046 SS5]
MASSYEAPSPSYDARSARYLDSSQTLCLTFVRKKEMLRHKKLVHAVTRVYKCPSVECGNGKKPYETSHKDNFKRHIKGHMKKDPTANFLLVERWAVPLVGEGDAEGMEESEDEGEHEASMPTSNHGFLGGSANSGGSFAGRGPSGRPSPYHQAYAARATGHAGRFVPRISSVAQQGVNMASLAAPSVGSQPAGFGDLSQWPVEFPHLALPETINNPSYTPPSAEPSYPVSADHSLAPDPTLGVSAQAVEQNLIAQTQNTRNLQFADVEGSFSAWVETQFREIQANQQAVALPQPPEDAASVAQQVADAMTAGKSLDEAMSAVLPPGSL